MRDWRFVQRISYRNNTRTKWEVKDGQAACAPVGFLRCNQKYEPGLFVCKVTRLSPASHGISYPDFPFCSSQCCFKENCSNDCSIQFASEKRATDEENAHRSFLQILPGSKTNQISNLPASFIITSPKISPKHEYSQSFNLPARPTTQSSYV